jgi:hypothetical protein
VIGNAVHVMRIATGQNSKEPSADSNKDPAAVALGRRGGLKGGKARAAKLSPEKRAEIARKAAQRRWEK